MKQLLLVLALSSALFSCKKETTTPTTPSNDVSISGFDCDSVKIAGTLTKDKVASNVTATLTYSGGNGKTYLTKSYTSSGVSGLTATLVAGTLANGEGTLMYTISGTPTTAGTANFAIALGDKSCTISITVNDIAQTIVKPGPNITDVEGNSYKTVSIGTQTWMAENLKVSKYSDGTIIPNVKDSIEWSKLTTGAWCYYNNDESNNARYGKLYNWYAVSTTTNGNKNVCPSGWHVPSDPEWTILTDYLGGKIVAGSKMKEAGNMIWNNPNTDATNSSLFTGLPGGYRYANGFYNTIGTNGFWWTSSAYYNYNSDAWFRGLISLNGIVTSYGSVKAGGLSVRCLKD